MKNVEALHNFPIWRRNLALGLYMLGFQHAYTYDHLLGGTVPILRYIIGNEEQAPAKVELTRITFKSEDSPYKKLHWLALYTSARWYFCDKLRLFSMGQR